MNLIIGSHVSFNSKKQLLGSVEEALSYNANTFMFYTGAPQNANRSELNLEKIEEADKLMEENNVNNEEIELINIFEDIEIKMAKKRI